MTSNRVRGWKFVSLGLVDLCGALLRALNSAIGGTWKIPILPRSIA